jgi:hypothetical protein
LLKMKNKNINQYSFPPEEDTTNKQKTIIHNFFFFIINSIYMLSKTPTYIYMLIFFQ